MNAFPEPFDIVTRLRDYRSHRIYMRYPDRDGNLPERVDWNLTGAEPNTLMVEAAAEIERLRFQLKVMTEEHRAACEDRDAMMRERDEAKQRNVRLLSQLQEYEAREQ